jgi:DNA (cytosine-5)-methyltransferase 1
MTYATTFSGIGGWELGLNACGWELQWQCEIDAWCRTLLNQRFGVPIYKDIRTICEHNPTPIDALIGSPPCQPFSVAGKKSGTSDERHLYPAFLALVRHLKPRWVLMEQVPAILSSERGRAFGNYIAGLAALGYSLVWHCIPACAVGANHQRDRLWIIANLDGGRLARTRMERTEGREQDADAGRNSENVAYPQSEDSRRLSKRTPAQYSRPIISGSDVANSRHLRRRRRSKPTPERLAQAGHFGKTLPDAERAGLEGANSIKEPGSEGFRPQQLKTTPPPAICRESATTWWAVEPELGRVANGIPDRTHRLKGLGNAIVPQIAQIIGTAINQIEGQMSGGKE